MEDIGGLAEYIAGLRPREKAVRRVAFLALRTGRPAAFAELSRETGLPPAAVRAAVDVLSGKGLVVYDAIQDAIIGAGALIASTCHTCGKPITLAMSQGRIIAAQPPDIKVWVIEADTGLPVAGNT